MSQPLQELRTLLRTGGLHQEFLENLKNHPVLHFSEHAERIAQEGFLIGEPVLAQLDFTDNKQRKDGGKPGYNFAFSVLHWDVENDCFDYEVSAQAAELGLSGMLANRALLCRADGVYTRHYDEFKQAVFWGQDAELAQALILERCEHNTGSPQEDQARWTARTKEGVFIVSEADHLSLRLCVVKSLQFLDNDKRLSRKASTRFLELYEEEVDQLNGAEAKGLRATLDADQPVLKFEI
jgi:hypothetical protein